MKLKINGAWIQTGALSLKEVLEAEGYFFPCGGKGVCGRCRITAKDFAVTERDKTFLSAAEIDGGVRLACDKTLFDGAEIECGLSRREKPKKLGDCDILAILGNETILIGILSVGKLIDSVVIEREGARSSAVAEKTKAVRSIIAHESIEFFERYGCAKAGTVYVVATRDMAEALRGAAVGDGAETIDAAECDLPAEEIYFAPGGNAIDALKHFDMEEQTLTERAVRLATDVRFRSRLG